MKVYNQGGRLFTHHEMNIPAGQFTTIPDHYVEGIQKLLKDYPTELVTADDARSVGNNAAATINQLKTENATLTAQVAKLQKLLIETPAETAPAVDTAPLHARIHELETAIASVKVKTPRKQQI
jgi:hypothetical protein